MHLLASPAKQWELSHLAFTEWLEALPTLLGGVEPVRTMAQDKRFEAPAWQQFPYRGFAQSFLLLQEAWHRATTAVPGVTRHHEDMVSFAARPIDGITWTADSRRGLCPFELRPRAIDSGSAAEPVK